MCVRVRSSQVPALPLDQDQVVALRLPAAARVEVALVAVLVARPAVATEVGGGDCDLDEAADVVELLDEGVVAIHCHLNKMRTQGG